MDTQMDLERIHECVARTQAPWRTSNTRTNEGDEITHGSLLACSRRARAAKIRLLGRIAKEVGVFFVCEVRGNAERRDREFRHMYRGLHCAQHFL